MTEEKDEVEEAEPEVAPRDVWTPGHIAHYGYVQAMIAAGGVEMPWENVSPGEQALWEAAAVATQPS